MCFDCCDTDNCNTMVDLPKIFGQTTNSSENSTTTTASIIALNTTDSSEPEDILNDLDLSNQSDEKPVIKKDLKDVENDGKEKEPVEILDDQEYQNEDAELENDKESKETSLLEKFFGGSDSAKSKDDSSLFGLFESKDEYVQDQPENATIAQNDTTPSISTESPTEPPSVEPSSASVYINSLVLLVLGLLIQVNL